MKQMRALVTLFLLFGTPLSAADNPFLDYQNYNHGYCPECDCAPCACGDPAPAPCAASGGACDPCAPVCGTECGVSICAIGVVVAAIAGAAAIIIVSGSGSSTTHAHN